MEEDTENVDFSTESLEKSEEALDVPREE